MQQKFNINNLPGLKIRVANAEESERAQKAMFELGFHWVMEPRRIPKCTDRPFLFVSEYGVIFFGESYQFDNDPAQEITLAELEALAAEKQGFKTSKEWAEITGAQILDPDGWDRKNFEYSFNEELISAAEFNNRLSRSTYLMKPLEIGNMPGMVYNPTDPGTKRAKREAQERYDAAVKWLEENSIPLFETDRTDLNHYPEMNSDVLKALRIASGLE